jgi:hypothetical protein
VVWFSDLGYYQRLVISFAGLFVAGFFLLLLLLLRDKKDGLWRSKQARRRGTCLLYTHSSSREIYIDSIQVHCLMITTVQNCNAGVWGFDAGGHW